MPIQTMQGHCQCKQVPISSPNSPLLVVALVTPVSGKHCQ